MPAAAHAERLSKCPRSLPARYPPNGAWPLEMPADIAAACLGYETTGKLFKAVLRNEAPRATATRLNDGRRVPVWSLEVCRVFLANRHEIRSNVPAAIRRLADRI